MRSTGFLAALCVSVTLAAAQGTVTEYIFNQSLGHCEGKPMYTLAYQYGVCESIPAGYSNYSGFTYGEHPGERVCIDLQFFETSDQCAGKPTGGGGSVPCDICEWDDSRGSFVNVKCDLESNMITLGRECDQSCSFCAKNLTTSPNECASLSDDGHSVMTGTFGRCNTFSMTLSNSSDPSSAPCSGKQRTADLVCGECYSGYVRYECSPNERRTTTAAPVKRHQKFSAAGSRHQQLIKKHPFFRHQ